MRDDHKLALKSVNGLGVCLGAIAAGLFYIFKVSGVKALQSLVIHHGVSFVHGNVT